jgi:hypothetical protein
MDATYAACGVTVMPLLPPPRQPAHRHYRRVWIMYRA